MSAEELVQEFLKSYQKDIIQMAIKFRMEHGIGMLIINLLSGKEELDVEYYQYKNLTPDLQERFDGNPKIESTIYYMICLKESSLIYEHDLAVE